MKRIFWMSLAALACCLAAQANAFSFQVSGEASATVITGTGTITITLTDLYVNPNSVADNLSGFEFTTGGATSASLLTSSAPTISVASGGAYTNGATVAPGWALSFVGGVTTLDDLGAGGAGPAYTLIGAPDARTNQYDAQGAGSIAGNKAHNPFLFQSATWTLAESGVTASSTVSNVYVQFGTTDNQFTPSTSNQIAPTPEPASAAIFLLGGCSLILFARRRPERLLR